jgi:hypothetical protein
LPLLSFTRHAFDAFNLSGDYGKTRKNPNAAWNCMIMRDAEWNYINKEDAVSVAALA